MDSKNPSLTRKEALTSARIVLHQELVQCTPATADAHHHSTPQDTHQTQLLRVPELEGQTEQI